MPIDTFELRGMTLEVESTEGSDDSPTPAANAIQVINGRGRIESGQLEREIDRTFWGAKPFTRTQKRAMLSGSVELLGAATVGNASPLLPLLEISGHAETLNASTSAVYNPISTSIESGSAYFYHDGELIKAIGSRARLTRIAMAIDSYCLADFEIMGKHTWSQTALPNDFDTTAFQAPLAIDEGSFSVTIDGTAVDCVSIELNTNTVLNRVPHSEGVVFRLADRRPSGFLTIYRPLTSSYNVRNKIDTEALVDIVASVSGDAGRNVQLDIGQAQMNDFEAQERDRFKVWRIPFVATPSASGNDEYLITFT